MKRTTIFLPESLERDLQMEARRSGQPMASLVREALAQYIAERRKEPSLSFIGCGASDSDDTAERHEELLWRSPHGAAAEAASSRTRRRKR